jgi:peptide/nickel transport system permease protein
VRAFLIRRTGQFVPVLLLGAIAVWAFIYALPGDPASVIGGSNATQAQLARIRGRLGLDRPVWVQFWSWLTHGIHGDFGVSSVSGVPVSTLLASRIPATVQLAVFALIFLIVIAGPLGLICGLFPRSLVGRLVRSWLSISLAIPPFWLGLLLILLVCVRLGILPSVSNYVPFWTDPIGAFRNTVLPALSLAVYSSSVAARFLASSVSEVMQSEYVRTARAKGAGRVRVVFRHALRNAMLPTITVVGLQLGLFLGGTIVIEAIFTYPGIGRLLYTALDSRDYAVAQATVLLILVTFLVVNLLVDVLYAALDPRIRVR